MLSVDKKYDIWEQKYRPQSIDETILTKEYKKKFKDIQNGVLGNLLLVSENSGTGKTTVARILAQDYDMLFYNTSDVNINTLRTDIRRFASTKSIDSDGKRGKVVIFDEFDRAGKDLQKSLRSFIEEVSGNCKFILTANYPSNLIKAIRDSRFTRIDFVTPEKHKKELMMQMIKRSLAILKNENISVDGDVKKKVATLVKNSFPDFRRVVRELQHHSMGGELSDSILNQREESDSQYDELFEALKSKMFKDIRSFVPKVSDNYDKFINRFFKECLERVDGRTLPNVILEIYDNNKTVTNAANIDIHITGLLVFVMMEAKFK
ncbi:MAG: DNA polymerase [Acidobacteria bacterium]|nr:DNA polymerase [Acidobacteriota bacterium]|tara:strand:+ start:19994 stop:20956 length:963 start_codon:yes stop_codon:yes gene_type:complete